MGFWGAAWCAEKAETVIVELLVSDERCDAHIKSIDVIIEA